MLKLFFAPSVVYVTLHICISLHLSFLVFEGEKPEKGAKEEESEGENDESQVKLEAGLIVD